MGKMLGAFADDDELDRPDLNKCPDCGCFFESDDCPLCGKRCPESMRAGNRKPAKKKKHRKGGGPQYKVAFIDWYHRWWFIIPMLLLMPLLGIILLATSPHKRGVKLAVILVAVVYTVLTSVGIGTVVQGAINLFSEPVDTSLTREEYVTACENVATEDFYRAASTYEDRFVTMTLSVKEKLVDADGYYGGAEYTTYYVCEDMNGGTFEILIRACIQDGTQNLVAGDLIRIYGEGAGEVTVYDMNYVPHSAPCVYVAYVDLIG